MHESVQQGAKRMTLDKLQYPNEHLGTVCAVVRLMKCHLIMTGRLLHMPRVSQPPAYKACFD